MARDALSRWVVDQIETSPILALMTGGVYAQPIVMEPEGRTIGGLYYAATTDAFDPTTGRIRPCVTVARYPRTAHPTTPWIKALADYVEVKLYGPDTPQAAVSLELALVLIRRQLQRKQAPTGDLDAEDNPILGICETVNDMLAPDTTADFPQAISAVERYRVSSVRLP